MQAGLQAFQSRVAPQEPTAPAQASPRPQSEFAGVRQLQVRRQDPKPLELTFWDRVQGGLRNWYREAPAWGAALKAKEASDLVTASRAVQAGTATLDQERAVFEFLDKNTTDTTFGYKVADAIFGSVGFMGDLALTGPFASAGKNTAQAAAKRVAGEIVMEAIEGGAERAAKGQLLRRGVTAAASGLGATAGYMLGQTATSSGASLFTGGPAGGRITASTYQRMLASAGMQLSEDEAGQLAVAFSGTIGDFWDTLPQGIADQAIEIGSELSGPTLAKLPVMNRLAALQTAVFAKWRAKFPNKPFAEFIDKVAGTVKWDGLIQELGEEGVGAVARAVTPGMDETVAGLVPRTGEDWENIAATAASIALMGSTAVAGQAVASKLDSKLQKDAAELPVAEEVAQPADGATETSPDGAENAEPQGAGVAEEVAQLDPATIPEAAASMGQREGAEPQAVVHAPEIKDRRKRKRFNTASKLAERFGVRLVPVASEPGEALAQTAMAGESGVAYFDVNAEVQNKGDRGGIETRGRVMHELVHELAAVDAETYSALQAGIEKHVSPEVMNAVLEDYRQRLGQEIPEEIRDEEMVANLTEGLAPLLMLADKSHGQATLERIARDDFGLIAKILDAVKRLANRFGGDFATRAEQELEAFGISRDKIGAQEAANAARLVHQALTRALEGRQAGTITDKAGAEAPSTTAEPVDPGASEVPAGTPVGKPLPGRAADLPSTFTSTQQKKTQRKLRRAERAARTLREKAETATPEEAAKLRARAAYQDERARDYRHQLDIDADLKVGEEASEIQDEAARRRPFEREMAPRRKEETRTERARRIAEEGEENPDAFAAPGRPAVGVRRVFAGFDTPEEGVTDAARRKLQDEFIRIRRIEEAARKGGADIPFEKSAYEAASSAQSRTRGAQGKFERRHVAPIIRTLQKLAQGGVKLDDADRYLYARHAPSRNEIIAERHPKKHGDVEKSPGSGMATSEANRIVEAAESGEHADLYKKLGRQVDRMVADSLKTRLDAELISQDYYDDLTAQWKHYVPLKDDAEGVPMGRGGGFAVRGKEFKRAGGRSREAENVLANAIQQGVEGISRAERNRVGLAFMRMLQDNRSITGWSRTRPEEPVDHRLLSEHQFALKEGGRQVILEFEDPKTIRALKKMGQEQFGPILKVMRRAASMWSQLNTSLSPDFVLTNLIRDLGTAGIHLSSTQSQALKAMSPKSLAQATRGMHRFLTESEKGGEWAAAAEQFAQQGGMVGWFYMPTIAEIQRKITGKIDEVDPSPAKRALMAATAAKDWIENLVQSTENGVRLSAFKALVDSGTAPARAATIARRLTVDFTARGEWSPVTNTLFVFSNASLQGTATMLRVLKTRRGKQFAVGLAGLGASMAYLNLMAGGDDEDGVPHYAKIPEWVRERNLILMDPRGTGDHVKIPLPQGWNMFFALGEKGAMAAMGETSTTDAGVSMLGAALESFVPIGGEAEWEQVASPTLLDPVVQHLTNTTFFGGKIKPEQPQFGPSVPESELYFKSVSAASREIAKWLNKVSGGDEVTPGLLDVSPELIDHYAEFMAGSAGASLKRGLVDVPAKVLQGEAPAVNEIPVVRRFLGESPEWWTSSTYYDHRDAIERLELRVENAREKGRHQEANALRRENAALWRLRAPMEQTDKQVKALRKRAKTAPEKQKEALEKRIQRLQMRFNARARESLEAVK